MGQCSSHGVEDNSSPAGFLCSTGNETVRRWKGEGLKGGLRGFVAFSFPCAALITLPRSTALTPEMIKRKERAPRYQSHVLQPPLAH